MSTTSTLMTADDLWRMSHDGNFHELVKGELVTMPPAGFEHGTIGTKMLVRMYNHAESMKLGTVVGADTGFGLERDPDTVRAADVAFVGNAKLQLHGIPKKYFPAAPDVVAEVISPSDIYVDVDEKVDEWLNAGTLAVWVINPRKRSVTVRVTGQNPVILMETDTLTGGAAFPGFSMPVSEIFA